MFGSVKGLPIWWPVVRARLSAQGLPTSVVYPQFAAQPPMALPSPTGFASLVDVDKLPNLKPSGREAYRVFLGRPAPRAFALASSGDWAWASEGDDPLRRALATCARKAGEQCRLYAVNDDVVWSEQ
jgi:hypothetical protein